VSDGEREALLEAIRSGDAARVRERVTADPALAAVRDDAGLSAVLVALYHQQPGVRDALVAAEPELDVLEAAALGRLDVLRAHLESDQDALGARTPEGFTPLHLAAFFGGGPAVRILLAAGAPADADADNPNGVRPLHSAVAAGDHDATRALLEAGADPNVRQAGGFTPLLAAAHADDVRLARLLLEHGADPALAADDGRDPASMAGERVGPLLTAAAG
jgi:ankyrin repeat protein